MHSIHEQKQALRNWVKTQRKIRLTPSYCHEKAMQLQKIVAQRQDFQQAEVVLFYAAMPLEVSTWACLERWKDEKTILLPVMRGDELDLLPYRGRAYCREALWGIVEPLGTPFTDYARIDLAFIPALAYDRRGHRLGYGKGYYDRLLQHPALQNCTTIGLAYDFQLVDEVPTAPHDQRLDEIIVL